jgi:hypothetical protein
MGEQMNLVVTTVHKPSSDLVATAAELAHLLNAPQVARENHSLNALKELYHTDTILVAAKNGPVAYTPGGEYFFHLSMAELRIKNLINGKHDHMVTALGLKPGSTVLDCTLGLGSDAIVASFAAGNSGKIVGIEVSPLIAAITGLGLKQLVHEDAAITAALRRITAHNADYNSYLSGLPAKSFDIVYFDPMFRAPVYSSSNFKPLRKLADMRPLNADAVTQACRVAKKRVVIKEAKDSAEFERLGITALQGGKYSSVQYGFIEVEG